MPEFEQALPSVANREAARAAGFSDDQVTRRLRSGVWTSLRHGRFTATAELADRRRWQAEVLAHAAEHRRPLTLSHAHAARAWGWPSPLDGWGIVTFTATSGPTRRGSVHITVAPLDPEEQVQSTVTITSPARTVVDCARTLPGRDGLAVADAALRSRLVPPDQLAGALERVKGWPGAPRARHVVALADGRRESPLESWSEWSFTALGLPAPQWQVDILDGDGLLLGRGDAWWREGVIGEADGRAKYRTRVVERGAATLAGYEAVLHEERGRESRFRRSGALVVRWEARDVLVTVRERELAAYVRTQLKAAENQEFTGSVRLR